MSKLVSLAQRAVNASYYVFNNQYRAQQRSLSNSNPFVSKRSGRLGYNQRRSLDSSSTNRLTADWPTQVVSIDRYVDKNQRILRARARWMLHRDDYYRGFIGQLKRNVVGGKGFVFNSVAKKSNGDIDKDANSAIEKEWKRFSKKEHIDIAETSSFWQMLLLFISTTPTDGEFLARIITGPDVGEYGIKLQLLDTEHLDVNHNHKINDERYIRQSIEFDKYGKPLAYHIRVFDLAHGEYTLSGRHYVRVPAEEIIHAFIPLEIGQKRGLPWAETSMIRLKNLTDLETYSLTAFNAGSRQMAFVEKVDEDAEDAINPLSKGDDSDSVQMDDSGNIIHETEGGTVSVLPEGYKVTDYTPDYPGGQFAEYVKTILRGAGLGLDMSYNSFANDRDSANFASQRTGIMDEREHYKLLQSWVIEQFCQRVFVEWLKWSITLGKIKVNGRPIKMKNIDQYIDGYWQGKRWDWVDPLKDAKAKEVEDRNGWISGIDIMQEAGRDPEKIAENRKRQKELMGDTLNSQEPGNSPGSSSSVVDNDEDEDEENNKGKED